jgi:protein-S-isoprenylcysteine O-methyltransferase Ste14
MALIEELEKSGNWLFRWRSYRLHQVWGVLCLLISAIGLIVRCYTVGHTPAGTSGRNTKQQVAEALNKTGAYSIVRNPLYLGNFIMGLGVSLFPHLWWLVMIYVLVWWIYYERIIFAEEAFLRRKYGEEYLSWAGVTPILIPDFRLFKKSHLGFSMRNVLKREYNGFFAVIAILFAFECVGEYSVKHKLEIDPVWSVLLGIGFAVWIVLLALKRFSKVLDSEGR